MSTITIIQGNNNDKDNTRAYMVKGEAGVSPTVTTTKVGDTATITITDGDGEHTFTLTDGVSPVVSTNKVGDTATITIEDAEGTHTFTLTDGVSPTVTTSKENGVTTITITDAEGTHTAIIKDGETYEVPTGSIIGFEGTTIPAGYEEVEGRKVATLYNASDVLNEGYQTKIKVDTLTSTTDLLTYADNSIVVGKGISKVLISGNVFAIKGQTDMSYLWTALRINRNGTEIDVSFALDAERDGFACTSHTGFLTEVQEGDKIYLVSMIGQIVFFRGIHNTYLTVDVVE